MIKLENIKEHETFSGGLSRVGDAHFDGENLKEVLDEIKEFSKTSEGGEIGNGFGNPEKTFASNWGIRINDVPYVGNWGGWKNEYQGQFDKEKVTKVKVNGGWWSGYNFDITTESEGKTASPKEPDANERDKALKLFGLNK